MTDNDMLIRLRYALDIKNTEMVEIFELGGMSFTKEDVLNMLMKVKDEEEAPENFIKCNNKKTPKGLDPFKIKVLPIAIRDYLTSMKLE